MSAYKVLIIGLGRIGMQYDLYHEPDSYVLSHARAFHQHSAFQLIAAVDPNTENCKLFERYYHCPAYDDLRSALKKNDPSLVVISNPTEQHIATLLDVLKLAKPKAVLCEKSFALIVSLPKRQFLPVEIMIVSYT